MRAHCRACLVLLATVAGLASCADVECPSGTMEIGGNCVMPSSTEMGDTASSEPRSTAGADSQAASTAAPDATSGGNPRPGVGAGGSGGTSDGAVGMSPPVAAGEKTPNESEKNPSDGGVSDAVNGAGADASAEQPAEGPCRDNPGLTLCDGAALIACNINGSADSTEMCKDEMLCQVGLSIGKCATCNPGTFVCEDAALSECQSGEYVVIDHCPSAALCSEAAGACSEMVCKPNLKSCASNGDLKTCNADGSEFANVESCGANLCDAKNSRCNECVPNSSTCEGDAAVRCNADGQGTQRESCSPMNECYTASCKSGACRDSPKARGTSCRQGVCDGSGTCVACLQDSDCESNEACKNRECVQKTCSERSLDIAAGENCDPDSPQYRNVPKGSCDPDKCQITDKIYQASCTSSAGGAPVWTDSEWYCNGVGTPAKYCTPGDDAPCRTTSGHGKCLTYGTQNAPADRLYLCGIPCPDCPSGTSCHEVADGASTCGHHDAVYPTM